MVANLKPANKNNMKSRVHRAKPIRMPSKKTEAERALQARISKMPSNSALVAMMMEPGIIQQMNAVNAATCIFQMGKARDRFRERTLPESAGLAVALALQRIQELATEQPSDVQPRTVANMLYGLAIGQLHLLEGLQVLPCVEAILACNPRGFAEYNNVDIANTAWALASLSAGREHECVPGVRRVVPP